MQSLVATACSVAATMPSPEDIVWEPDCSLPMRLLLGGHILPDEGKPAGGTQLLYEGWLPSHIRPVTAAAAKSKSASLETRLQAALQCHSDRLAIQSHCTLWLRCVRDVCYPSCMQAAHRRRARFVLPSGDSAVIGSIRKKLVRDSDQRFARLQRQRRLPEARAQSI